MSNLMFVYWNRDHLLGYRLSVRFLTRLRFSELGVQLIVRSRFANIVLVGDSVYTSWVVDMCWLKHVSNTCLRRNRRWQINRERVRSLCIIIHVVRITDNVHNNIVFIGFSDDEPSEKNKKIEKNEKVKNERL